MEKDEHTELHHADVSAFQYKSIYTLSQQLYSLTHYSHHPSVHVLNVRVALRSTLPVTSSIRARKWVPRCRLCCAPPKLARSIWRAGSTVSLYSRLFSVNKLFIN